MSRTAVVLTFVVCFVAAAFAGGIGPDMAMLGHGTLSPVGIDVVDAVAPLTITPNPACLAGLSGTCLETDLGKINFDSGPLVTADTQMLVWSTGDEHYRVMRYGVRSNTTQLPLLLPDYLQAGFEGESLQISYAKGLGNWSWGISLFPTNYTETHVDMVGYGPIVDLRAASDFAGRIGGTWSLCPELSVGAYWHYETGSLSSSSRTSPVSQGYLETTGYADFYQTVGASWTPRLGTLLYADYQVGKMWSKDLDSKTWLFYVGATQYLTPDVSVSANCFDGAFGTSINFFDGNWNVGASYSPNGFQSASEMLGAADTVYLWAAKYW